MAPQSVNERIVAETRQHHLLKKLELLEAEKAAIAAENAELVVGYLLEPRRCRCELMVNLDSGPSRKQKAERNRALHAKSHGCS